MPSPEKFSINAFSEALYFEKGNCFQLLRSFLPEPPVVFLDAVYSLFVLTSLKTAGFTGRLYYAKFDPI